MHFHSHFHESCRRCTSVDGKISSPESFQIKVHLYFSVLQLTHSLFEEFFELINALEVTLLRRGKSNFRSVCLSWNLLLFWEAYLTYTDVYFATEQCTGLDQICLRNEHLFVMKCLSGSRVSLFMLCCDTVFELKLMHSNTE